MRFIKVVEPIIIILHLFAHIVDIVLCPVFQLVYIVSKVIVKKSFAFLQKKRSHQLKLTSKTFC